jgi:23S rRNA (adenine2503-C2)-methyltransferase
MLPEKIDVKNMRLSELADFMNSIGEEKYRAKQIFSWLHKGVYDFQNMSDISKGLRDRLDELAYIDKLDLLDVQISEKDGSRKYLFRIKSGHSIESVFLKYSFGNSICLSSQAGCRMGCTFCASGIGGLKDNLPASLMLDQILAVERHTGTKAGNIVVMGIGEPFDNYDNLCRFIDLVHDKAGLNLGMRTITVSTCGLIPQIEIFGDEYPKVGLAVSLHAPNDKIRNRLMPVNKIYPVMPLLAACRRHAEKTGRRITVEYALIRGVNDSLYHAKELAERLSHMLCHVNLIMLNPIKGNPLKGSKREAAKEFLAILTAKGISATIRREMGGDIDAACGQLRRRNLEDN